jgi:hypothetical protein
MIDKTSKILLTLVLGGESLATAGVYKSAEIKVLYPGTDSETVTTIKPLEVVKKPVFNEVVNVTTLGNYFIEAALQRPSKPRNMSDGRFLRTDDGKIAQKWNKLSNIQKLEYAVNQYAISQSCEIKSWELL